MSADQIAVIRPAIIEAIQGAPDTCVTLEVEGDADRWVQFTDYTINAAYPFSTAPQERVKSLPAIAGLKVDGWEAQKYATFTIPKSEPMAIASWIDAYFTGVLGCPDGYDLDTAYQKL